MTEPVRQIYPERLYMKQAYTNTGELVDIGEPTSKRLDDVEQAPPAPTPVTQWGICLSTYRWMLMVKEGDEYWTDVGYIYNKDHANLVLKHLQKEG